MIRVMMESGRSVDLLERDAFEVLGGRMKLPFRLVAQIQIHEPEVQVKDTEHMRMLVFRDAGTGVPIVVPMRLADAEALGSDLLRTRLVLPS